LKKKTNMKKTTKKAAPAKAAPATKSAPKAIKAPAKKAAAPAKKKTGEPPVTFISASIDIGFGNHLYLRGEGPGLSWDHGIAMDCTGADLWTASVKNAAAPVVFKVLVNDLTWSTGNDFVVEPGQSITITPNF
jgi:hypothetical protein